MAVVFGRSTLLRYLSVTILTQAAVFGARPMVSYRAISLNATTFEIGLLSSSFVALAVFAALPVGRLVDRYGGRRLIMAGAAGVAVGCAALTVVNSLPGLAISQSILGLGLMTMAIGTQVQLIDSGSTERQGNVIGWYASVTSLGQATGPIIGGFLAGPSASPDGIRLVFLLGVCSATIGLAVAYTLPRIGHREPGEVRPSVRSVLRMALVTPTMRAALIASAVVLCAWDIILAYLPVYGDERGITPNTVGLMLGALALSQMASRLVLGRLIRSIGPRRLLIASMVIPAATLPLLIPQLPEPALFGVMCAIGLGLGLGIPMTIVMIGLSSTPGVRGVAVSLRHVGNRVGQLTIPAVVAAIAGGSGVAGIFVSVSALLLGGSIVTALGTPDMPGRVRASREPEAIEAPLS